jgi:hypothetical protein
MTTKRDSVGPASRAGLRALAPGEKTSAHRGPHIPSHCSPTWVHDFRGDSPCRPPLRSRRLLIAVLGIEDSFVQILYPLDGYPWRSAQGSAKSATSKGGSRAYRPAASSSTRITIHIHDPPSPQLVVGWSPDTITIHIHDPPSPQPVVGWSPDQSTAPTVGLRLSPADRRSVALLPCS